jgi:hypothetical protein
MGTAATFERRLWTSFKRMENWSIAVVIFASCAVPVDVGQGERPFAVACLTATPTACARTCGRSPCQNKRERHARTHAVGVAVKHVAPARPFRPGKDSRVIKSGAHEGTSIGKSVEQQAPHPTTPPEHFDDRVFPARQQIA